MLEAEAVRVAAVEDAIWVSEAVVEKLELAHEGAVGAVGEHGVDGSDNAGEVGTHVAKDSVLLGGAGLGERGGGG